MDIVTILRGGLGNQLFQYACVRNLQLAAKANVFMEKEIGFLVDKRYQRSFELEGLIEKNNLNHSTLVRKLFLCEKIGTRVSAKVGNLLTQFLGYQMIFDDHNKYVDILANASSRRIYLSGYWQSELYFKEFKTRIAKEIADWLIRYLNELEESMIMYPRKEESVAIGIRTYSETKHPAFHAKDGVEKTVADWQKAIDIALKELHAPVFYVFSTDHEEIVRELNFRNSNVIRVNQDRIRTSQGRLISFASCKHHIFNNSSFFWWGAYVAPYIFPRSRSLVIASNNFLNAASHPRHWNTF